MVARTNSFADQAAQALGAAGVTAHLLHRPGNGERRVDVGTMHRIKGLEYRCIAVGGACAWNLPLKVPVTPEEVDPVEHASDGQKERSLLYVACTRAREGLAVSWHGRPSPFLEPLLVG